MRISDWSSDVCSSDLVLQRLVGDRLGLGEQVLVLVGQRLIRLDADDGRAVVGARRQVGGVPVGDLVDLVGGEGVGVRERRRRSEEHTSELQSLMRISYAVFCLKKKHNVV